MGRRENPVAPCDRELEKLVRTLRDQRAGAGLTYKQLAAESGCSASTLIRAASGEQVPRLKVVRAYTMGCGGDPDKTERLWKRARYRAVRGDSEGQVPHPCYVRDFAALHTALVDLYYKDGARPYQELEKASARVLAHATVGRFLRKEGGRPPREFVLAFAQTCGMKGRALQEWGRAWDRSEEDRLYGGGAGVVRQRSSLVVGVGHDGPRVQVFSDPTRTPDGHEGRRISFEVDAHTAPAEVVITQAAKTLSQLLKRSDAGAARHMRRAHQQPITRNLGLTRATGAGTKLGLPC